MALGGYAATVALAAWSARQAESDDLPKIAVVTSAFFVASLIHVPIGPTSVHLLIPGLVP
jgi:cobalt/nickel transport system permease protein